MSFQSEVRRWVIACLGRESADNVRLRCGRFIEEAIELAQAGGITYNEALKMVEHVYSRPVGATHQEIGGVCVTLAALCSALNMDQEYTAEQELRRCWDNILKIHERNKTKPQFE